MILQIPTNKIIPTEEIQKELSDFFEYIPFILVLIIVMASIGFKLVWFNGDVCKKFYHKFTILCIILIFIAYIPVIFPIKALEIIPKLEAGIITALFFTRWFEFWRKKKELKSKK